MLNKVVIPRIESMISCCAPGETGKGRLERLNGMLLERSQRLVGFQCLLVPTHFCLHAATAFMRHKFWHLQSSVYTWVLALSSRSAANRPMLAPCTYYASPVAFSLSFSACAANDGQRALAGWCTHELYLNLKPQLISQSRWFSKLPARQFVGHTHRVTLKSLPRRFAPLTKALQKHRDGKTSFAGLPRLSG